MKVTSPPLSLAPLLRLDLGLDLADYARRLSPLYEVLRLREKQRMGHDADLLGA
jgi:hypothetical protein